MSGTDGVFEFCGSDPGMLKHWMLMETLRFFKCLCWSFDRFGIPFWLVGEFTTHFRTYLSGHWDVHWNLTDLDLDPWPNDGVLGFQCWMSNLADSDERQICVETMSNRKKKNKIAAGRIVRFVLLPFVRPHHCRAPAEARSH